MSLGTETVYGIVSDSHQNPYNATLAMSTLVGLGAQALILNGDLSEDTHFRENFVFEGRTLVSKETRRDRKGYYFDSARKWTSTLLDTAVALGVPTYVQPGSHEHILGFGDVVDHYSKKYPNIIDTTKDPKIFGAFHQVVFLPGSDVRGSGEYGFHSGFRSTALYRKFREDHTSVEGIALDDSWDKVNNIQKHRQFMASGVANQVFSTGLDSLVGLVDDPEHTILFSHIPSRFNDTGVAVDMAYFAVNKDGGFIERIKLELNIMRQWGIRDRDQIHAKAKELGYTFSIENRGNKELSELLKILGVRKVISGHFHESGGRAHDSQEKQILPGVATKELFWNVGQVDQGRCGLLYVRKNSVSYRNVDFTNYVRNLGHDQFGYVAVDYSFLKEEAREDSPEIILETESNPPRKRRVRTEKKKVSSVSAKAARKKARPKKSKK